MLLQLLFFRRYRLPGAVHLPFIVGVGVPDDPPEENKIAEYILLKGTFLSSAGPKIKHHIFKKTGGRGRPPLQQSCP